MSINGEAELRAKLSWAYDKIARKVGKPYQLYRPVAMNDAFSTANFLGDKFAAFTLSKNFSSKQTEGFNTYTAYSTVLDMEIGDIYSDGSETFVIVWNRGIEEPVAIRTTHLVEVYNTVWTTTDGLQQERVRIAKNVPASITKSSSVADVSVPNVNNPSQSNRWEVRVWSPNFEIKQTDNIIFGNNQILHIDNVAITEMCQIFTCTEMKA